MYGFCHQFSLNRSGNCEPHHSVVDEFPGEPAMGYDQGAKEAIDSSTHLATPSCS